MKDKFPIISVLLALSVWLTGCEMDEGHREMAISAVVCAVISLIAIIIFKNYHEKNFMAYFPFSMLFSGFIALFIVLWLFSALIFGIINGCGE